jgi:hypothetical protein
MELTEREQDLLKLAEKYDWDASKMCDEYGKSYANTCYKLWELQQKMGTKVNIKTTPSTEVIEKEKVTMGRSVPNLDFSLATFVPAKSSNKYIERRIDKDVAFWADCFNAKGYREAIALIGEAGSGKNELIYKFAEKKGLPLLVIPCDDSQVLNQLLGYWQAIDGTTIWREGLLCSFVKKPSVVVFDEVNCLPASRLFMLHELLENRKLFSKDAPAETALTQVHTDCHIFLAMNPPTVGYSGTNRLNIALGSRPVFIEVPSFNAEEMGIDTGDKKVNTQLILFYNETRRIIKQHGLRSSISIRNINRIANAIKNGASICVAVLQGYVNSLLATASDVEKATVMDIARTTFGADVIDEKKLDVSNVWK